MTGQNLQHATAGAMKSLRKEIAFKSLLPALPAREKAIDSIPKQAGIMFP